MSKHLSIEEKLEIRRLVKERRTQEYIGKVLWRDQGTISREINRNKINWYYYPLVADKKSKKRRVDANKRNSKLLKDDMLREEIIKRITSKQEDRSPDTIAGRLKEEGKRYVVSNTIYKYIYEHEPWLRKHLRYKKWYKKRWAKELRKIRSNKRDIREREKIIEERARIWDIEIDTVVSKWRKWRLFTAFDRTSRLSWIRKLENGRAEEIYKMMVTVFSWENILSITSDNGKEFSDWELAEMELQIPIYFARPYHSWERWTNENGNRCIRKRVPKKKDFSDITEEEVSKIEHMINNKPRKIFNYRTPFEVHYWKKTHFFS